MRRYYRINENIRSETVRLIDGQENPVLSREEALRRAKSAGLDLIEVSDKVNPPAVKISEFRKFLYEQGRKGNTKVRKSVVKEIRMSPGISENDMTMKLKKVGEFLEEGHQVKLTVQFRGRENAHPEVGMEKLQKALALVVDIGKTEGTPKKLGSFLSVIIVPR